MQLHPYKTTPLFLRLAKLKRRSTLLGTYQRISQLPDEVVTEVQFPEATPRQGGGVVPTTPDDHIIQLSHLTALDDENVQLPTQSLKTNHQVQGDLLQLKSQSIRVVGLEGVHCIVQIPRNEALEHTDCSQGWPD